MERDNYMSAEDAKSYGIVDEVVKSRRDAAAIVGEPIKESNAWPVPQI